MLRDLEEQFETEKVERIRGLVKNIEATRFPRGACRIYAEELVYCLKAGALLACLNLAGSLLEISIRHIVLQRSMEAKSQRTKQEVDELMPTLEEELEERRDLRFGDLCDFLSEFGFFDSESTEKAKDIYRKVRTPIHHGLPVRFIKNHSDVHSLWLQRIVGGVLFQGSFEESILDNSLDIVEEVVSLLQKNLV